MSIYNKEKGCFPAKKLHSFYGKRSPGQGLPKEPKTAIEFCQNCKKPKRKCNGNCVLLTKFIKEQKNERSKRFTTP